MKDKSQKWISVREKGLPQKPERCVDENGQAYIIVARDFIVTDSKGQVFQACYSYANKSFWYDNSSNKIDVIAYMPMPEPYMPD